MPENTLQKLELPPIATAGAAILIPVFGIPLALHALTGAAIGGLTFVAANLILGPARGKILNIPGLLPGKSSVNPEEVVAENS